MSDDQRGRVMNRVEIYELQVHVWGILPEGETPRNVMENPAEIWDNCNYRSHAFLFTVPPSREDFRNACRRLPWTSVWQSGDPGVFVILDANPWPHVSDGHKGADQDLFWESHRVGRLRVWRDHLYGAAGYNRAMAWRCNPYEAGKRLYRGGAAVAAVHALEKGHNTWMERVCAGEDVDTVAKELVAKGGLAP